MGIYLDAAFLSAGTFVFFFYLLSFSQKDVRLIAIVSALSAFCVGVLSNKFLKKTKLMKSRKRRTMQDRKLKALVYSDETQALNAVYGLLSKKYRLHDERICEGRLYFKEGIRDTRYALTVVRKFKSSPDDLLPVWRDIRKNRSADKILFAIPAKCDPDIRILPLKLTSPDVQILDKTQLKKLLRKYDADLPLESKEKKMNLSARLRIFLNRKRALRYFAYALLLYFNYILFGKALYLIFASMLLSASVFSFFSDRRYEFLSD